MNAVVVHGGGPTAVINASLVGIVDEARRHAGIRSVLGARFGIEGLIGERLVDLSSLGAGDLAAVGRSSSSAIGTSRRAATPTDIERVLAVCRARGIRCVFYTGGNGSMGTARQIAAAASHAGQPLAVIGVPKTIDNDLAGTDHAPGYASAARFFAHAARDIAADNRALPAQVQILEVLGRNSGWIAAATSVVRRDPHDGPHLIYLPERPLPLRRLLDDVQRVFDRLGRCVVVVCEGQLDDDGEPFGADVRRSSGKPLAMNLAHQLALLVTGRLALKARGEKPGLAGRASTALRSDVDWHEARLCGQAAVRAALQDASGVMVTLEREPGPAYSVGTGLIALERVDGVERRFPEKWLGADGTIAPVFQEWIAPLIGEIDGSVWL